MTPELHESWISLREELTGRDFPALLRRYVGMRAFTDEFDDMGRHVNQAEPKIRELAVQAARTPALFEHEWAWLVTKAAENGYFFGYELAKNDPTFSLLPVIIDAQTKPTDSRSLALLAGFLRRVFETAPAVWERVLDELVQDRDQALWVGELTCSSGMSDPAATRLVKLAASRQLRLPQFKGINARLLTEPALQEIVRFLQGVGTPDSVSIAVDLTHSYSRVKGPIRKPPKDLTFDLLTHPAFLNPGEEHHFDTMTDYYWAELGKAFLDAFPGRAPELAERLVESFGNRGSILDHYHATGQEVLARLLQDNPVEFWKIIERRLDRFDRAAFRMSLWLRNGKKLKDGEDLLDLVPPDLLWKWADAKPDKRAPFLASFVQPRLEKNQAGVSLARDLLARYGDRSDVRKSFSANYSTETMVGSLPKHYEGKRKALLSFREAEKNPNVLRWIDEYVKRLDADIRQGVAWEERLGLPPSAP